MAQAGCPSVSLSQVLYLKNLGPRVAVKDLVSLFARFQKEDSPPIQFRLLSGRMRGQAFITFPGKSLPCASHFFPDPPRSHIFLRSSGTKPALQKERGVFTPSSHCITVFSLGWKRTHQLKGMWPATGHLYTQPSAWRVPAVHCVMV